MHITDPSSRRGPARSRRTLRVAAGAVAAALSIAACGGDDDAGTSSAAPASSDSSGGGPTSDAPDDQGGGANYATGGTIRYRLPDVWRSFDIQESVEGNTHQIARNAYASLLHQTRDGELVPYVAESFEITQTTATFVIKQGVTCTDGTELTASMVRDSFERLINSETSRARLFGPGPYTLTADDATRTFVFETEVPFATLSFAFGDRFPMSQTAIICPAGLADGVDLSKELHGVGPYVLDEVVEGDHVTMRLRDDFTWGPGGVTADTPGIAETLVYQVVSNDTTAANLLLSGDLDVADIGGPDLTRVLAEPSLSVDQYTYYATQPLVFNQTEGHPTADPVLRRALSTAIDREEWVQAAFNGQASPAYSFIPATSQCYSPQTEALAPTPSIDDARAILEEGGYDVSGDTVTKDGAPVKIVVIMDQSLNPGPEYLRNRWTELGIEVDLRAVDYQTYVTDAIFGGNHDVSMISASAPGPVPGPLTLLTTGALPPDGGQNYAWVIDPELDAIVAEAMSLPLEEACPLFEEYQLRVLEQAHYFALAEPFFYRFGNGVDVTNGESPLDMRVLG